MRHEEAYKYLKIARGHIEGIIRMVEEEKYCIDISKQINAVIAILKKANHNVLAKHIETCVVSAAKSKNEREVHQKIDELIEVMKYCK